ncbi:hypothetical protein OHB24_19055 [Kribbella sp. NBC_00482]|uniref:hypothetical protein n=1 Tax=Kribbella sp. NBC_00482 TaxID=2975968 RepID=UPI002E16C541
MRVLRSKPAAIVGALALATTGFVAVTVSNPDNADAAGSCLGSANSEQFKLPSGTLRYPSSGTYFKTSSKCRDINVASDFSNNGNARAVKVCFKTAGCQDHWTNIPGDPRTWKVVASNVKDGTEYYLKFYSYGKWYGLVAD